MSLLKEYYDSIAFENISRANAAEASAQHTRAETNELGANAQSQRDLQSAQAGQAAASGALAGAQAGQVGANATAARGLDASRTTSNDVSSGIASAAAPLDNALKGAQTGLINQNIRAGAYNLPGFDPKQTQGFEKGGQVGKAPAAAAVPGKGKPGPHDTVPVMLAPGEGVLNKGAMEHYGMATLDHMNAMGQKRMGAQSEVAKHLGLPDPHAVPGKGASEARTKAGGMPKRKAKAA